MGRHRRVRRGHPGVSIPAGVHVNYQETKLHLHDGLPKLKDYPKEMGGSGIAIAE
jgi:hypothetical protein